jgi:hypothetical protein
MLRAHGKAVVFARRDVVLGDTRPWLEDPTVRDVPFPGERVRAGRPVCTVLTDGAGAAAACGRLVPGDRLVSMARTSSVCTSVASSPASLGLSRQTLWASLDSDWAAQLHRERQAQRTAGLLSLNQ